MFTDQYHINSGPRGVDTTRGCLLFICLCFSSADRGQAAEAGSGGGRDPEDELPGPHPQGKSQDDKNDFRDHFRWVDNNKTSPLVVFSSQRIHQIRNPAI